MKYYLFRIHIHSQSLLRHIVGRWPLTKQAQLYKQAYHHLRTPIRPWNIKYTIANLKASSVAGYHSGPNRANGNIPKGREATREVIVVLNILGRPEELRGRLDHAYGDRLIDYTLATPEEREALKAGMKR